MITSLIERLAKLIKNNPYNYQMVSIFATMVTLSALIAGCEAIKGTAIPTMPPTGEPGMTDDVTPTPTSIETPTPTSTPVLTPSPTPVSTPTPKPFESKLNIEEGNKDLVVDVDNETSIMTLVVNNFEMEFFIKMPGYENVKGELVAKVFNLLDTGYMGLLHENGSFDPDPEYFNSKFHAEIQDVILKNISDFNSLIIRLKAYGVNVSEEKAKEMTGKKTLQEIGKWIEEIVPSHLWPIERDFLKQYSLQQDIRSNVPRNNKKLGDKELVFIFAEHENGKIDIALSYLKNDKGKAAFHSLSDDLQIVDGNGKINQDFFKGSADKSKVIKVEYGSVGSFAVSEYGKYAYNRLQDINPDTVIDTIIDIYNALMFAHEQINHVNFWYIEPTRTVNLNKDTDTTKKNLLLQEVVLASIRLGLQDLDRPKQKIYDITNL